MSTSEHLFFGDLLKQFRKRRRLNQKQLAERIEVSRETVSLWERGMHKPEAEGILYQIVDVLGLTTQEQQQLFEAYTITALVTSFHNPPFKRNPYFVGRGSQLTTLHTLLMAGKQVALTQAISGLGGIGKTQLALEYVYRHQKSYHDIFWVHADTEESVITSYIQFASLLHLPEYEEADQNMVRRAFRRWLRKHTGWLLIFDNIEDFNILQRFVPVERQGAVLLTTRRQVTEPAAQALELEILPENDAILFLLKRTKVLPVDMSLEDASEHDIEMARAITHLLGHLPLALDQAGAYILETPCSLSEYFTLFQAYQDQLLQRRIGEQMPTDHPESVAATFRLNFQQVQLRSNAAGELLCLFAFLAPDAIPEEVLTASASSLGSVLAPAATNALQLNRLIEVLRTYSLIQRNPAERTLSIHRLVQVVLQDAMPTSEQEIWASRAIEAMKTAFPDADHTTWNQCERLLPHALACITRMPSDKNTSTGLASLLSKTASYLHDRARYTEAEPLLQRALSIWKQTLDPDYIQIASLHHDLALLYVEQGKYEQARPYYEKAVLIQAERLGNSHPQVINTLSNLAFLSLRQGDYEQAEQLFQCSLSAYKQILGADHLRVASSLNNLASFYKERGAYKQAEQLYQKAMAIWEQTSISEHPHKACLLYGLAGLYLNQGNDTKAKIFYQKALDMREKTLGAEHPETAYPLYGLCIISLKQGKYEEAEQFSLRALRIQEQSLNPEYLNIIDLLNVLSNICSVQGKYAEAKIFRQRALKLAECGTEVCPKE